jgi:hypothetical protein
MDRFHGSDARYTLDFLASLRMVSPCELLLIKAALSERALAACLDHAETIHLHIKVDDIDEADELPGAGLEAVGGTLDHARRGFVKYRMPGGINAIFSHIPVSADDLRECASSRRPRPFLDHIGIDVRTVNTYSRAAFDALPTTAASRGWAHRSQGGAGRPVRCCHVEVDEKHWLFPVTKDHGRSRLRWGRCGMVRVHPVATCGRHIRRSSWRMPVTQGSGNAFTRKTRWQQEGGAAWRCLTRQEP